MLADPPLSFSVCVTMDLKISDKASQLAKEWVKNMKGRENSDSEEADDSELKTVGRQARLGLGATYVPHSHLTTTINPVEKKLRAKLNISKGAKPARSKLYKADQATDKSNSGKSMNEDTDDDDEVGRASLFNRKRKTNPLDAHLLGPLKTNKKWRKS